MTWYNYLMQFRYFFYSYSVSLFNESFNIFSEVNNLQCHLLHMDASFSLLYSNQRDQSLSFCNLIHQTLNIRYAQTRQHKHKIAFNKKSKILFSFSFSNEREELQITTNKLLLTHLSNPLSILFSWISIKYFSYCFLTRYIRLYIRKLNWITYLPTETYLKKSVHDDTLLYNTRNRNTIHEQLPLSLPLTSTASTPLSVCLYTHLFSNKVNYCSLYFTHFHVFST